MPLLSFRVRPRIKEYTNNSVDSVMQCFSDTLASPEFQLDGTILKSHVLVKVPPDLVHYWSQEMQLEISENPFKDDDYAEHKEATVIRGFVGPKSTVWTLFMFLYTICGVLLIGGVIFGSSQAMINIESTGYWFALPGGIGILLTFVASQIGQRLGAEQSQIFLDYINKSLKKCVE